MMHSATRKFKNFMMTGSDKVIKSLQEVNPQFPTDLVTFIEEILNGKLRCFVQCRCRSTGDDINWGYDSVI